MQVKEGTMDHIVLFSKKNIYCRISSDEKWILQFILETSL